MQDNQAACAMRGLTPLLEVFDMDTSLEFYRDVLGFEVLNISEERGWCMLSSGNVRLMLNTAYDEDERPPQPLPERVRWHRDVTLYLDADPHAVYRRLMESEWPVREPYVAPYGVLQVNVDDPDGYKLAFVQPVS
jgi:glyoxylase I family protein